MTAADDQSLELAAWAARVAAELRLEGFTIDVDALLALAGAAAHSVRRPAAPLTTYVVGFAAGHAAATGSDPAAALAAAIDTATRLAATAAAERDAADDIPPKAPLDPAATDRPARQE
ncbi:DUF6457 domain-containing protein [Herbiconiux sp. P15]|uniref:DUF6457 domain-containing protein n=1 Tax=Herbiconiux liukaitaii TaxID=3342799 RepID=UPI0035BA3C91